MASPGKVVILGAGPTGLGAAHRLHELGCTDYLVLEQNEQPGGLSRSCVDDQGFTWDLGGHVHFSHYNYYTDVLDKVLPGGWLSHLRAAWIWMQGRFIPYPLQSNIRHLDSEDIRRALDGLEQAARQGSPRPAAHFGEWIDRNFGPGLAELFMLPYNRKVWGYPPETMAFDWIAERVQVPSVERLRQDIATGRDDVSWGPNQTFRFPRRGGTGAVWRAVADELPPARLRLRTEVVEVDAARRRVRTRDGGAFTYDHLLSTAPLDRLVAMTPALPDAAKARVLGLRHSSVHVVGLGFRGPTPEKLADKCWLYFPGPQCPCYRLTVFSNYSPHNAPVGCWSVLTETCETPERRVNAEWVRGAVLAALQGDDLIPPKAEPMAVWHQHLEYGYPTPGLERDGILGEVLSELARRNIASRGRFGGWKYEVGNQDHCFMQGVEWVNRVVLGQPETTFAEP